MAAGPRVTAPEPKALLHSRTEQMMLLKQLPKLAGRPQRAFTTIANPRKLKTRTGPVKSTTR
jgi:hypothetical protein